MNIRILTVGKKSEPWLEQGIGRYLERLRGQFSAEMEIIPHSRKSSLEAPKDESERLLRQISPDEFVILLDETGKNLSSPELSSLVASQTQGKLVFVIGGAHGVSTEVLARADFTWSLSRLVFPHQLVRLILAEQLYRAQDIANGGKYHHS